MGKAMKKQSLPEELILEILVELPVKSLLRFRCVCKSWCDLIKSPNFINLHLKRHNNNESILIIRSLEEPKKHFLSLHSYESLSITSPLYRIPHIDFFFFEVCEPCNGLLCLSYGNIIVLYNPSMREMKVLPPRPFACPEGFDSHVLATGLGFDSNTNDIKVVAIVKLFSMDVVDGMIEAEIYSLSTHSWKKIDLNHDHGHHDHFSSIGYAPGHGIKFNGAFHWIAQPYGDAYILSFDMKKEVFQYMELPNLDPLEGRSKILTVLNECLALFAYTIAFPFYSEQSVDIWVMHEYGISKSWTKQVSIGPVTGIQRPLMLWKNETIILESWEGRLLSCALDTHEMNDLDIHGILDTLQVLVYKESLISIKPRFTLPYVD